MKIKNNNNKTFPITVLAEIFMIKKIYFVLLLITVTNIAHSSQTSNYPAILEDLCGRKVTPQEITITTLVRQANPLYGINSRLHIMISLPTDEQKLDFSSTNKDEIISAIKKSRPTLVKSADGSLYAIKMNNFLVGHIFSNLINDTIKSIELSVLLNTAQVPNFIDKIATQHKGPDRYHKDLKIILGESSIIKDTIALNYCNQEIGQETIVPAIGILNISALPENPILNDAETTKINRYASTITDTCILETGLPHQSNITIFPSPNDTQSLSSIQASTPTQEIKKEEAKQPHWFVKTSKIMLPFAAFIGILLLINKHYSFININPQFS
jgi:hypothetical protein